MYRNYKPYVLYGIINKFLLLKEHVAMRLQCGNYNLFQLKHVFTEKFIHVSTTTTSRRDKNNMLVSPADFYFLVFHSKICLKKENHECSLNVARKTIAIQLTGCLYNYTTFSWNALARQCV